MTEIPRNIVDIYRYILKYKYSAVCEKIEWASPNTYKITIVETPYKLGLLYSNGDLFCPEKGTEGLIKATYICRDGIISLIQIQ